MKNLFALVAFSAFGFHPLVAYEVWIGTHLATSEMANTPGDWDLTARRVEGVNVNRAPHDTDPASNNDYRSIYASFTNTHNTITEFARSQATRNPDNTDELAFPSIAARLEAIFNAESTFNYDLTAIMFYDERGTFQGTEFLYQWTDIEIQYLRDWMDDNGHSDVELKWNVRNNSVRNRQIAAMPIVDSVEIEASTTALLNNTNNQITFFNWFWTNPATADKEIALQIPRTLNSLDQFKGTRRVAQMLGGEIGYGEDGMRSDRLIFLPVTYNDNYPYLPETVSNGTAYTNTLTSIALSLVEQRQLFEGRLASLPTIADADSTVRTAPPTIESIANQVTTVGAAIPNLPITVGDTDTAVTSLTVSATSSNETVVPTSGIVIGGSGANRTLAISPAANQSGNAEITIRVSDGVWFDETTFRVTIGGVILGESADANVKDDGGVLARTDTTSQLGAGGNSPFVDRCTVYVFQFPDLGNEAQPFESASFFFNYESKAGVPKDNDLYGLGRRSSATVLGGDYYGQTTANDSTDATRLETAILTNGTSLGSVATSAAGDAALVAYLNEQYDSGAGIGEYVFLRLNTSAPKDGINRAILTMSEGGSLDGGQDTRPRIVYTVASGAGLAGFSDVVHDGSSSSVLPFSVSNFSGPVTVTASSSNPDLVPNTGLSVNGSGSSRNLIVTPVTGQGGQTLVTVEASDGIETVSVTFTFTVLQTLFSEESDAEVQPTLSSPSYQVTSAGADIIFLGTGGGNVGRDRCLVFPFQLPDLGEVSRPFFSADFTVNYAENQNSPIGEVYLSGLGRRETNAVLTDDYWSATGAEDSTDATRLQNGFLNAGSGDFGPKTTDVAGSAALANYLNDQYANGAGAGDFVFLRLSADAAQTGGASRYMFTSADGAATAGDVSLRPQIQFLTVDEVEIPGITLVNLGGPVDGTVGTSWSDSLPAHQGANYVVPSSGNLRSEIGDSIFPGFSLTVQAGGRFQARALDSGGESTVVERLVLEGGASFSAGSFAEITAGTGSNLSNVLAGALANSGFSRLTTFGVVGGNPISRGLRVDSLVSGTGRIQVRESSGSGLTSVTLTNPSNTFSGVWEVENGSRVVFENAGAVGAGEIEVKAGSALEVAGDWASTGALTVADASGTEVVIGSNDWMVSELVLDGLSLAAGTYPIANLNALSSQTSFLGSGTVTITDGPITALEEWRLIHFGTSENTGTAADDFDADNDGESNLLEFATGQNPNSQTVVDFGLAAELPILEFTYPRSVEAVRDGMIYIVEWSETLLAHSWSSAGVVDGMDPSNAGTSEIENRLATVPAGDGRRFVRLRVVLPQ
jgi:hypothetical protein